MAITTEMIVALLAIATPLFTGAFVVWRMIEKKVKDGLLKVEVEVAAQATERARLMNERRELDKRINERLDHLEQKTVLKEDYIADREATNRAIDNIALSLREGLATVTGRIDLVLFEVGRVRNGKPSDN